MQSEQINAKINELDSMRREMTFWRVGGVISVAVILAICLYLLNSSVQGLVQQGPAQDIYLAELQRGMDEDLVPRLQQVASQTLTEMQPVVIAEFEQLNTRVPELTQATLKEVEILQINVPERAEKVLDETFGQALRAQEPKIREMFPSVTEDQVQGLMASLGSMATNRGSKVADELLLPHTNRMRRIVENLHEIESTEKATVTGEAADWHMGLLVLDLVREDLKVFEPKPEPAPAIAAPDKTKVTKR